MRRNRCFSRRWSKTDTYSLGEFPASLELVMDGETRRYVPDRTAIRHVTSYGAIGRSQCSECGMEVSMSARYCATCGARITDTTYERR